MKRKRWFVFQGAHTGGIRIRTVGTLTAIMGIISAVDTLMIITPEGLSRTILLSTIFLPMDIHSVEGVSLDDILVRVQLDLLLLRLHPRMSLPVHLPRSDHPKSTLSARLPVRFERPPIQVSMLRPCPFIRQTHPTAPPRPLRVRYRRPRVTWTSIPRSCPLNCSIGSIYPTTDLVLHPILTLHPQS